MRKVTKRIVNAFANNRSLTVGNSKTDGKSIWLHGNKIVTKGVDGDIYVNNCGWDTATTKERLNGLIDRYGGKHRIYQKNYVWYWGDGKEFPYNAWVKIN